MYTFYLHFLYKTQTNPYQLLAPIFLLFVKFCLFTSGLSFFNLRSGGPSSLSLWKAKMKIKNSWSQVSGCLTRITSSTLPFWSYPVNVDDIHLMAYCESIHLVMNFLPYFALVSTSKRIIKSAGMSAFILFTTQCTMPNSRMPFTLPPPPYPFFSFLNPFSPLVPWKPFY